MLQKYPRMDRYLGCSTGIFISVYLHSNTMSGKVIKHVFRWIEYQKMHPRAMINLPTGVPYPPSVFTSLAWK